jgi:hypothetical protein
MDEVAAATLKQFILEAGGRAERALYAYYKAPSGIDSILRAAMSVLSCEGAQAAVAAQLEHLSEPARSSLLAAMHRAVIECGEPAASPDAIRRILIELSAALESRVPGSVTHALSRLDLVISLGQTDDHQMLLHPRACAVPGAE